MVLLSVPAKGRKRVFGCWFCRLRNRKKSPTDSSKLRLHYANTATRSTCSGHACTCSWICARAYCATRVELTRWASRLWAYDFSTFHRSYLEWTQVYRCSGSIAQYCYVAPGPCPGGAEVSVCTLLAFLLDVPTGPLKCILTNRCNIDVVRQWKRAMNAPRTKEWNTN